LAYEGQEKKIKKIRRSLREREFMGNFISIIELKMYSDLDY